MSLGIKLDENLGNAHVHLLTRNGYAADRAHDEGLSGASDSLIWERVCAEQRFFITLDLDFSDVRRYVPGTHPGILLLRARSKSRQAVLDVLTRVIADPGLESLRGCLAVADDSSTRVRRPSAREAYVTDSSDPARRADSRPGD